MQESVSAILYDRAHQADGISRMLALSIGVHIAIVAGIWLSPTVVALAAGRRRGDNGAVARRA